MESLIGSIIGLVLGLIIGSVALTILALVLRGLWNSTLPDLFGIKPVTTWQAIKIMLISSLLFGGHRVMTGQPMHGSPAEPARTSQSAP
jgi:hypothetical protein